MRRAVGLEGACLLSFLPQADRIVTPTASIGDVRGLATDAREVAGGTSLSEKGNRPVELSRDGLEVFLRQCLSELAPSEKPVTEACRLKERHPRRSLSLLYFAATDGANGVELWRSDGTNEGTFVVGDINPGGADASPRSLAAWGPTVCFAADDGVSGVELWRTDSTLETTHRVADINPDGRAEVSGITLYDGLLHFAADDGASGSELWSSDGTEAGTTRVADIREGPDGSAPENLAVIGSWLYFSADDGERGRELWRWAP